MGEAGVLLISLPPYSSDLNSIETSFAVLKSWIRRHQVIAQLYEDNNQFGHYLDLTMRAQEGEGDPGYPFRKSGIYYRAEPESELSGGSSEG